MIRHPELGDRIKRVLAPRHQGPPPPVMNPGMPPAPGHPQPGLPVMPQNGMPFPMPHGGRMMPYPPGHRPPFPGPPKMMGPPPPPVDKYWDGPGLRDRGQGTPPNIPQGHCMRGCGRGYRGQGRPSGNSQDMSNRPICRHFILKGHCRYESNCAFYHPGVNGPPLYCNQGGQLAKKIIRQPDLGERIKQVLAPLQQGPPPPVMNPGMPPAPGHPQPGLPMMPQNGMPFPMPHGGRMMPYPPGPRPPFPGPPRMMRPPPPPPLPPPTPPPPVDECWGGPGPADRCRGPPPNMLQGHYMRGHGRDMSNRPICRHFMGKGHCRYESNCAFYHPGVNGPPLALPKPPSGQ